MPDEKPCLRQQELIAIVQQHLSKLAELMHTESALIGEKSENGKWLDVDKLIEHEHRREHGC